MDQIRTLADSRLLTYCIYCGGSPDTRDHVPSRCFLEKPFPQNLPVVGCCRSCNQSFSKDEEYLVCLIESAVSGSTNPENIRRASVAKIMRDSPALKKRIETSAFESSGRMHYRVEKERAEKVLLKLARGHAAFELSRPLTNLPDHLWWGPIELLTAEERDQFNSVHIQKTIGEIGSRNQQRLQVTEITLESKSGKRETVSLLINDWITAQDNQYRYIAIDDANYVAVRFVISEYLACEAIWKD